MSNDEPDPDEVERVFNPDVGEIEKTYNAFRALAEHCDLQRMASVLRSEIEADMKTVATLKAAARRDGVVAWKESPSTSQHKTEITSQDCRSRLFAVILAQLSRDVAFEAACEASVARNGPLMARWLAEWASRKDEFARLASFWLAELQEPT